MLDPREFDQFVVQAQTRLTGASLAGIKAELYDVLKEFFSDSNVWTEDIVFQATADEDTYTLTPLEEGKVIRLVGVWDDKGIPVPAFMRVFGEAKLLHAPSSTPAATWFARVVKTVGLPTVKNGLPQAPEWALSVYSIQVLDGLLGKMMTTLDKAWTNNTQGVYHLRRFRTGIQVARTAAARANNVGAQEWSYPRMTHGSQRAGISTAWPTTVM